MYEITIDTADSLNSNSPENCAGLNLSTFFSVIVTTFNITRRENDRKHDGEPVIVGLNSLTHLKPKKILSQFLNIIFHLGENISVEL